MRSEAQENKDAELARLRALLSAADDKLSEFYNVVVPNLKRERDEALKRWADDLKRLDEALKRGDEALAQVTMLRDILLLNAVLWNEFIAGRRAGNLSGFQATLEDFCAKVQHAEKNIPGEARALLEKAQRLAEIEMTCEKHPWLFWPHDDCAGPGMPVQNSLDQLRRMSTGSSEGR